MLDAAKSMVLNNSPYALLEGAPLTMIDAVQILRAVAMADTPIDVIEVFRADASELAYEVPIVEGSEEAVKAMLGKDVSAVAGKGGSLLDSLYVLVEREKELEGHKVSEIIDKRPPLINPLWDFLRALRASLIYPLRGHAVVGQKKPFGIITPLKFLRFLTLESTLSQLEMGESAPLERAAGDLAEPLPTYPTPETKVSDLIKEMIELKSEVLPVVAERRYVGVASARGALSLLI
ncbi:hypothetical protein [Ignicoccus hospitalis]|uniref:hypothetical protein n=1 Tax=Ignicoccus hospitalis TaxID=160233 RepID=UPI00164F3925|nr:hypothetical protein [Ignicoccus hospitalis]HIH90970.1 hypothetical protein [Desulfurococcaceae archaeon]